jgi:hypothetical protein
MLKELCDWIEDNSAFVCGTTLQVGWREQEAPDRCVVIQETAGGDSNYYQPDIEWLQIQVVARGKTYFNARDDARTIHDLLNGAAGIEIGASPTFYIMGAITAVNPPQYIGQDEERRYEFSTNYRVAYYNKSGS